MEEYPDNKNQSVTGGTFLVNKNISIRHVKINQENDTKPILNNWNNLLVQLTIFLVYTCCMTQDTKQESCSLTTNSLQYSKCKCRKIKSTYSSYQVILQVLEQRKSREIRKEKANRSWLLSCKCHQLKKIKNHLVIYCLMAFFGLQVSKYFLCCFIQNSKNFELLSMSTSKINRKL